jgi:hypothetical protein
LAIKAAQALMGEEARGVTVNVANNFAPPLAAGIVVRLPANAQTAPIETQTVESLTDDMPRLRTDPQTLTQRCIDAEPAEE